jgi:amino acid permease
VGFWAACCQSLSTYVGVEIIAIIAEETERQRESLPPAIRRVARRTIFYHVGAVLALGLNVNAGDPILQDIVTHNYSSPFVLMVQRAGITGLVHVLEAVTLIASLTIANANLYVSVILFKNWLIVESGFACTRMARSVIQDLPQKRMVQSSDIQCSCFLRPRGSGIFIRQYRLQYHIRCYTTVDCYLLRVRLARHLRDFYSISSCSQRTRSKRCHSCKGTF